MTVRRGIFNDIMTVSTQFFHFFFTILWYGATLDLSTLCSLNPISASAYVLPFVSRFLGYWVNETKRETCSYELNFLFFTIIGSSLNGLTFARNRLRTLLLKCDPCNWCLLLTSEFSVRVSQSGFIDRNHTVVSR